MRVFPIKALQDNYMYLLVDDDTREAAAVDPVNASAMTDAITEHGVDLKAILTTHHHYDHANGNSDLLGLFPQAAVYGGDARVQALTKQVSHGEKINVGKMRITCLSTPCHTKGHICYYVTYEDDPRKCVFTGDTLFIAGCGRFFEGTADQMNHNLNQVLGNLPSETLVYCGHEYTVNNLRFAIHVEPRNTTIKHKLDWARSRVENHEPTVPSTIGEEKKINPFMRLKEQSVRRFTGEIDENEVMSVLRVKKNEFQ